MITGLSDIHDRTLFTLGDWHIVRTGFEQGDGFKVCYAIHISCAPIKWNATIRTVDNLCFRCGDKVPDELQALVTLFHWGSQ